MLLLYSINHKIKDIWEREVNAVHQLVLNHVVAHIIKWYQYSLCCSAYFSYVRRLA